MRCPRRKEAQTCGPAPGPITGPPPISRAPNRVPVPSRIFAEAADDGVLPRLGRVPRPAGGAGVVHAAREPAMRAPITPAAVAALLIAGCLAGCANAESQPGVYRQMASNVLHDATGEVQSVKLVVQARIDDRTFPTSA